MSGESVLELAVFYFEPFYSSLVLFEKLLNDFFLTFLISVIFERIVKVTLLLRKIIAKINQFSQKISFYGLERFLQFSAKSYLKTAMR